MNTRLFAGLLAGTAVLLGGCGTLPEARPFAEATNTLSVTVVASGTAITDSMDEAGSAVPGDAAEYQKLAGTFGQAWRFRVEAAQAMVTYAESIADLVAAGTQGSETADAIANSLTALAAVSGVPLAAPAVGVAGDAARLIVRNIAIVRASRSLEGAVASAQPGIDLVAGRIVDETEHLVRPILKNLYKNIASGIKSRYEADANFSAALHAKREALRRAAIDDAANLPKLEELDHAEATVAASLKEQDRQLDAAAAAYKVRLQLLDGVSAATASWAQAHRDLAAAIRDKRKVDVTELLLTIQELRDLVKKVRQL
jgi:hypothetical protein